MHLPPRRGDAHLERVLRAIDDAIDVTGPPPAFDRLLADVTTVVRRRSILAVITDDVPLDATIERTLRRLTAQHEVLVVAVADADIAEPGLAGRTVRTVGAATRVPAFLRTGIALHDDLGAVAAERQTTTRKALARIGVASTVIRGGEDATLEAILGLLAQQRLFGARVLTGTGVIARAVNAIASVPDTLPPADERIYGPQPFTIAWLFAGIAVLAAAAGLTMWAVRAGRPPALIPARPVESGLAGRYLAELDDLDERRRRDGLDGREVHHELSALLRRYAAEHGTAGAPAMSSDALAAAGVGPVAAAVQTFEPSQFEETSRGDPAVAIERARTVVTAGGNR